METDMTPESTQEAPDREAMSQTAAEAIEAIRPAIQMDGGDIRFNGIDDDLMIHVELAGACGSCAISEATLKGGVERILMDRIPGIAGIVDDTAPEEVTHAANVPL